MFTYTESEIIYMGRSKLEVIDKKIADLYQQRSEIEKELMAIVENLVKDKGTAN